MDFCNPIALASAGCLDLLVFAHTLGGLFSGGVVNKGGLCLGFCCPQCMPLGPRGWPLGHQVSLAKGSIEAIVRG